METVALKPTPAVRWFDSRVLLTLLIIACTCGVFWLGSRYPSLQSKAGADPDSPSADGQTALMLVARSSNVAAAKLLLEHGATPAEVLSTQWTRAWLMPTMARPIMA